MKRVRKKNRSEKKIEGKIYRVDAILKWDVNRSNFVKASSFRGGGCFYTRVKILEICSVFFERKISHG